MPETEAKSKKPGRKPGRKPKHKQAPPTPAFARTDKYSITEKISRVIGAKESPVDIEEIALEFYTQVGGAKGYVDKIIAAYGMTRVGSAEQARLLDLMNDLFKIASARRGGADLDQASDEELMQLALELGKKSGVAGLPVEGWIDHVCI